MASTPEGKVKQKVRDLLVRYGCWIYMPVPTGYGRKTLDFICCLNGMMFAIETKAPGKKPTALQSIEAQNIRKAGGQVFVIDGTAATAEDVGRLAKFLKYYGVKSNGRPGFSSGAEDHPPL